MTIILAKVRSEGYHHLSFDELIAAEIELSIMTHSYGRLDIGVEWPGQHAHIVLPCLYPTISSTISVED